MARVAPQARPRWGGISVWDIGGCNCALFCTASPCNIPQRNLAGAATNTFRGTSGTGTVTYLGGCIWGGCIAMGMDSMFVEIDASGGTACYRVIYFLNTNCSGGSPGPGGTAWGNPLNCVWNGSPYGVADTTGLSIHVVSCSPYDVVLGAGIWPSFVPRVELT